MTLPLNIRSIREARGLKMKDLAALVGVSVAHMSEVERGKKNLNNHLLTRIAKALDVAPAALIAETDSQDALRLATALAQLSPEDRARVSEFAEALLRSQQALQHS
jgi:transcriptional regulator with XRE-family HTH domain